GGGYVKIGATTATNYSDTTVRNGTTYYYIVRGVDTPGNEGVDSAEASATPAFPIGYAVIQDPKTINPDGSPQTITSSYTTVYGQVFIDGLTNAGGDPDGIRAQVGFGTTGSNPTSWVWNPMSYNAGHTGDNNYEYMGQLRADAPGSYRYLVRFSDDGGRSWVYGDQDGFFPGEPGDDTPGTWQVVASADTSAPGAPVASIDFGASSLTVKWSAVTASDLAEYRVYRGTTPGGQSATPLAIVAAGTLSYVDSTVGAGQTYYYTVKAYDTSLNASPASNEVSHKVEPKLIQVTFRVKVPSFTPAADTIYITGQSPAVSPDPLCGYCGGNPATAMHETAPGSQIWEITLGIPDGTQVNYKYTRGTYDFVEEWGTITGIINRVNSLVRPNSPTDLTQLFDDTSDTNPDDSHKAVQNWRDALVSGTTPANGAAGAAPTAINVTFNWDVDPEGTDFSNAIAVSRSGAAVAGTITDNAATNSLTFTPSAALAAGSYTVTVDHVVAITPTSDGIKIRTPYTFTFTVS
ncbi:MAG: Ig-like domain-containing protein, partial [Roseiflexaceae bacterium]